MRNTRAKKTDRDPRGGHPASIEALREHGGTAALTHQTYRWLHRGLAPSCQHCVLRDQCPEARDEKGAICLCAEREHAEIIAEVMALPWTQEEDRHLALSFAKVTVGLNIIDASLSMESPFLPGAPAYIEPQPILKTRANLLASQVKLAAQLGLSPAARARLATDPGRGGGAQIAQAFRELEQRDQAAARAGAVDAEFTPEPDADQDGGEGDQGVVDPPESVETPSRAATRTEGEDSEEADQ